MLVAVAKSQNDDRLPQLYGAGIPAVPYLPGGDGMKCPVCHGAGSVTERVICGTFVCPHCGGTGEVDDTSPALSTTRHRIMRQFDGLGFVPVPQPLDPAEPCGGCHGAGSIFSPDGEVGLLLFPCSGCGGTGKRPIPTEVRR